eukprot:NODE_14_length_3003_cov_397.679764_g13_i0.p1 GENE.NODE_14_length_3003_cov_397.679764_g13_i0~~NODE_14_length_3003_cov_397.679764_g13_i0.p1  ORF type:complete len:907 (+),score=186.15 NODE_14_length_3003_cov_397.679764_g13_i0:227-2947(+)
MASRNFPNPSAQYFGHNVVLPIGEIRKTLANEILQLRNAVAKGMPTTGQNGTLVQPTTPNYGMYIGLGGAALAYWHLWRTLSRLNLSTDAALQAQRDTCLQDCVKLLNSCTEHVDTEMGFGFYCGPCGIWALGVAVYHHVGETHQEKTCWRKLVDLPKHANIHEYGDELLYGSAGYLYSLMFACKSSNRELPAVIVQQIVATIINNGKEGARREGNGTLGTWPLFWYGPMLKQGAYLGAAHGVVGILYILLCVWDLLNENQRKLVGETAHKLAAVVAERGALPTTSVKGGANEAALLHWCHGIPGVIPVLVKSGWVLNDFRFYNVARGLGTILWEKGILLKGNGLCHGVSGNAYCFLTLWRLTREHRFLYYALEFWKTAHTNEDYHQAVFRTRDPQRQVGGVPDAPYSLMEGLAGSTCLTADLLLPDFSHFPGWETSTAPPALRDWLHPKQGLFLDITKTVHQLCRGVWSVPCMDPSFTTKLRQKLWTEVGDRRFTDAIRLGATYTPLVNGLAAFVQTIVDAVMLPTDPNRPFTGGTTSSAKGSSNLLGKRSLKHSSSLPPFAKLRTLFTGHKKPEHTAVMEVDGPQQYQPEDVRVGNEQYLLKVWRAYVLRYDDNNHPSIQTHCDSSDVTFNLCLERSIRGGYLVFDNERAKYKHVIGDAVIQWGDIPHHTHNVWGNGERVQLVMLLNWCKESSKRNYGTLDFMILPLDVQTLVAQFCEPQTLASLMYCCKELEQVASSPIVWKSLYQNNIELESFVSSTKLEPGNDEQEQDPSTPTTVPSSPPTLPPTVASPFRSPVPPIKLLKDKYQDMVKLQDNNWKKCYQTALQALSLYIEEERDMEKQRDREFWMAIIGCYPVHNIRRRQRGAAIATAGGSSQDDTDSDELNSATCEECSILEEDPMDSD